MTGEASPEELLQLQFLAQENPQLESILAILAGLWGPAPLQNEKALQQAWQRHAKRMEKTNRNSDQAERSIP